MYLCNTVKQVMDMDILNTIKQEKNIKKFAVDSASHTLFYGVIGGIVALTLGIDFEIYITMSIIGTAIQFLSGGIFGKFLDFARRLAKV
jgi:hypothetical protein